MSPEGCQSGRVVTLDASPSLPSAGGKIISYIWDLGGGVRLKGRQVSYRYPEGTCGLRKICLTVTDQNGLSHTTCRNFCISQPFRRGDVDIDGKITVMDAISLLCYFFKGTPLLCLEAADANDSGSLELADLIRILDYLFLGHSTTFGPPFSECGFDKTPDPLGCESYDSCD